MKKRVCIKTVITAAVLLMGFAGLSYGQDAISQFAKLGAEDAKELSKAYLSPFGNALGAELNSGWFNTAKPHKLLGFDITFTNNLLFVPAVDKTYDVNDLGLQNLKLVDPKANPESHTIFGKKEVGPEVGMNFKVNNIDTTVKMGNLPKGLGLNMMYLPSAQLRLGLIKNTNIIVRFAPELHVPGKVNGKFNYWGVGFMHDLLGWLPAGDLVPLSLSLQGGYTKFKFETTVSEDYALVPPQGAVFDGTTPPMSTWAEQGIAMDANAINANLIVSKKIAILTLYGAGGYNYSKTTLSVTGNYPVPDKFNSNGQLVYKKVTDPIEVKNTDSYFKGTFGFRLNMALFFTFHADYTVGKYQVLTTGLGFTFR